VGCPHPRSVALYVFFVCVVACVLTLAPPCPLFPSSPKCWCFRGPRSPSTLERGWQGLFMSLLLWPIFYTIQFYLGIECIVFVGVLLVSMYSVFWSLIPQD
jgi:hypothetical protein